MVFGAGACVVLLTSCGSSDGKKNTLVSLSIEPGDTTLQIENDTAVSQTYSVKGTYGDGHVEDLTAKVTWGLDPSSLGVFNDATFTSGTANGGVGVVTASLNNVSGSAKLTLKYNKTLLNTADGTLPDNPQTLFASEAAPTPARKPEMVYPTNEVVLPPNLGVVEFHWHKGTGNTLFEFSFTNSITTIKAYTRCVKHESTVADGCIWSLDPVAWRALAYTNRGAEPLSVTIRGTSDAGGAYGQSDTQTIEFTKDDILGGVYYWENTDLGDNSTIMRFDFGEPDKKPEPAFAPEVVQSKYKCIGCHVVSPDGNLLAARSNSGDAPDTVSVGYLLYDNAKATPIVNETRPYKANNMPENNQLTIWFSAFSPDSKQLLVSKGNVGDLMIYKTDCTAADPTPCMTPVQTIATGGLYTPHVAWAPDGSMIAASEGTHYFSGMVDGRIVFFTPTGDGGWSAMQEWVPRAEGVNRFTPYFAPDSSFIVFTESSCAPDAQDDTPPGNCDAYHDFSSKTWGVLKDSHTPVYFERLNAKGPLDTTMNLVNTFPRFSPFASKYKVGADEDIFWLTFSSHRRPGLRPLPPGSSHSAYLWMVAIRPSQLREGKDPSFPAFVMPIQDFATSNRMAEWTKKVVRSIAQ